jgi:hypothetical protein
MVWSELDGPIITLNSLATVSISLVTEPVVIAGDGIVWLERNAFLVVYSYVFLAQTFPCRDCPCCFRIDGMLS